MGEFKPTFYFFIMLMAHFFVSKAVALKVFDFEEVVLTDGANLSYAQLSSAANFSLPDTFILCSSHIQAKIHDKTFYVLYDVDNAPWFSVSIWEYNGEITLWADVRYGIWFKIGIIEKPWTNFWIHICVEIDLISGRLSSSINGGPAFTLDAIELEKYNSGELRLTIGLSDHSWDAKEQFPDSVTNINIFHSSMERDIEEMSSNPCVFASAGDYMAWQDMKWDKTGDNVREVELAEDVICDETTTYMVPLPMKLSWTETKQTCSNLGHAEITESKTEEELKTFVEWFNRKHGPCKDIWTPFNDEDEEGIFVSTNTGMPASYLSWMWGQPNGGNHQNIVAIRQKIEGENSSMMGYHDDKESTEFCGSCTLDKRTVFTLWGRCEHTYLGKIFFLFNLLFICSFVCVSFPFFVPLSY